MNDHEYYLLGQANLSMANLDTSSKCILNCAQCYRLPKDNQQSERYRSALIDRVRQGREMPVSDLDKMCKFFTEINFCGQISDPIMHSEFYELLDLAAKYPNVYFNIATAAHAKNIEWYQKAFEKSGSNIMWTFGLDGLADTSATYRVGQNSQLVYDAMILGASMGKNIQWQYIVFEYNEHQVEEARAIAKEHGIRFAMLVTNRNDNGFKSPDSYKKKTGVTGKKRTVYYSSRKD